MASEDEIERKCFTFIWKLENASYCWQTRIDPIVSPCFTVDEIHGTNWKLEIYPSIERQNIGFYLHRQADKILESAKIDCDLVFLSSEGAVLQRAFEEKNAEIESNGWVINSDAASRSEVFLKRKSEFLPQDTLTVRCRMWKSVGGMSKDMHCFARTCIGVERRSFVWSIKNFSTLSRGDKKSYVIKSNDNGKSFMILELFLSGGRFSDETIRFKIIPNYQNIKVSTFQLSIVDASKNAVKCFQDDFWYRDNCDSKDFTLIYTKDEFLENKSAFLQNNVLSLLCECTFSLGTLQQEIENIHSDISAVFKKKSDNRTFDKEFEFPISNSVLVDNLKSMLNNSSLSDVKLKTRSQTHAAHKFILGARSPVFKAMFSNDMKEKNKECVDIEDLNDDTVLRLLRYIYSAEVEELEWTSATELYEAADKYEILTLKDICSSYLKSNLCTSNSCKALLLADLHQDENLKGFVQKFILSHGEDIMNSEEWGQLAGTNLKLAYETMHLKFKK